MPQLDHAETDDALVRSTRVLPMDTQAPDAPDQLTATWEPYITPSGVAADRLVIAWDYTDKRGANAVVGMYAVYVRDAEEKEWDGPHLSYRQTYVLCGCESARDVVVTVVPWGTTGAALDPDETPSVLVQPRPGHDVVPPAPTDVIVRHVDDMTVVQWAPPEFPGLVDYEIRIGSEDIGGTQALVHVRNTTRAVVPLLPYGVTFYLHVVAMNSRGQYGGAALIELTPATPADTTVDQTVNLGPTWTNAGSETTNNAGVLEVTDGLTEADYVESTALTLTKSSPVMSGYAKIRIENVGLTWDTALFAWQDGEAAHRTWQHGLNGAEWYPEFLDARDGPESLTWDELEGVTWDDDGGYDWDSLSEHTVPDSNGIRWEEANFTWDSVFAEGWTWDGPTSSQGTGVTVQVRFSQDTGTSWGEWETLGQHDVPAGTDMVQTRVSMTQPTNALRVFVDDVALVFSKPRDIAATGDSVTETPSGTVNGSNVNFSLSSEPTSGKILLIRDGVVMQEGSDYGVSGTALTYSSGAPATWHIATFVPV